VRGGDGPVAGMDGRPRGGRGTRTRWSGVTTCKGNGKGARGTPGRCDGERKGGGVRRWGRHVEGGGGQGGLVGRDMWRGGGRGPAPAVGGVAARPA
jgi:hypothetical protein